MNLKQLNSNTQKAFRILPFIFIAGGVILYLMHGKNISSEQIFNLAPQNYFAAIIYLLVMYGLKSLSIIFPLIVLYISTGMILPSHLAIIVNIVGIVISLSIPYVVGHFSNSKLTNQLVEKYPKLKQVNSLRQNSEWFFVFIIRILGILPMDIVSMFMGSIGISYRHYLSASILAMLPNLLAVTFIGATITNPRSPEFILSCIAKFTITAISILVYRKTVNKQNK